MPKYSKSSQYSAGGIGVTTHAISRFRLRCSSHPLLCLRKKPTANEVRGLIRQLYRKGKTIYECPLERIKVVQGEYGTRAGRGVARLVLQPSFEGNGNWTVVTVLLPEMAIKDLREHF